MPAAAPALRALVEPPGRYTASFAIQGLARLRAADAAVALRTIVEQRQRDEALVVESIRALGAMRDAGSARALVALASDGGADVRLRVEAVNALTSIGSADVTDEAIDLILDAQPLVRAAAMRLLATADPETFLRTLSGLDADADWGVRAGLAEALGGLPDGAGVPRLRTMLRDGGSIVKVAYSLTLRGAPPLLCCRFATALMA